MLLNLMYMNNEYHLASFAMTKLTFRYGNRLAKELISTKSFSTNTPAKKFCIMKCHILKKS